MACVQPRDIVDNKDKRVVDPYGHPLPPCIVMERGESLDMWSARAKPDRTQAISVRYSYPAALCLYSVSVAA